MLKARRSRSKRQKADEKMDFTFLFIVILMLLAVKSGLLYVAAGLFVLLIVTALKSRWLLTAAIIGGAVVGAMAFGLIGEDTFWPIVGGLFIVLVILAKKDSDHPMQEGGYGGM